MLGRMVIILVAATCGMAQDPSSTFTDTSGRFQFRYPSWLQLFTGKKISEAALLSYMPLCEKHSIVCVVDPATEYKNTNFQGTSFQVGIVPAADEQACLKFAISLLEPSGTVNGVRFVHGSSDSVAAGHSSTAEIYRAFQGSACYEIRIESTQSSLGIAPSGSIKRLTTLQQERIRNRMNAIFDSFQFLTP